MSAGGGSKKKISIVQNTDNMNKNQIPKFQDARSTVSTDMFSQVLKS